MKKMKISKIGTLKNGINFQKKEITNPCKILGVADFKDNIYADYTNLGIVDSASLKEDDFLQDNDILFVRSNGNKELVGRTLFIENISEKITFSGFCIRLRLDEAVAYPKYIYYLTKTSLFKSKFGKTQQTNINNLSQDILKDIEIELPDMNTQVKIANLIDTYTKKIYVNNNVCTEIDTLAKQVYDYWFVQFDYPNENGVPYKSNGGKMVWSEELQREIPYGWEVAKFDDIVLAAPKCKSIKAPDYKKKGKYPIVDQAANLITGYTDDAQYVYDASDGTVVFGDVTTYLKYINFPFAKGTDGTKIINTKNNRIPALLLYQMLQHYKLPTVGFARHYMFLREIKLLIPPEDLCIKYDNIFKNAMNNRRRCIFENQQLEEIRDFILPMLMNGQLKIL